VGVDRRGHHGRPGRLRAGVRRHERARDRRGQRHRDGSDADSDSDAESHAEEDRRARELAEARNNGENAAYQAERQLTELADQVDADSKARIEEAIKEVRDSLESEDPASINARTEALQSAFHAVSEAIYQQAQAQAAASGSGPAHPGSETAGDGAAAEEDVVDAEVVDEGKG